MNDTDFAITGLWRNRPQAPDEMARRYLALTDALAPLHPAFRAGWVWVKGNGIAYDGVRHNLAEAIAAEIARDDNGVPTPAGGYRFALINTWNKASPQTVSLSVQDGWLSTFTSANRVVISTPYGIAPDPSLVTYDVFRPAMLAACKCFDADYCWSYPCTLIDLWSQDEISRLSWMTYLGPELASMVAPPASAIVERRPKGGLFMAATRETFDADRPDHLAVARDIKAAIAPINAWARARNF